MAKKIRGIYVPIGLDTQQLYRDLDRLNKEFTKVGEAMVQSFGANLNPERLTLGFNSMVKGIGNVRDALRALDNIRLGHLEGALNSIVTRDELGKISQALGVTETSMKKFLTTMANNTVTGQAVAGLHMLERALGTTRLETLKAAEAMGLKITEAIREQYLKGKQRIEQIGAIEIPFKLNTSSFNRDLSNVSKQLTEYAKIINNTLGSRLNVQSLIGGADAAVKAIGNIRTAMEALQRIGTGKISNIFNLQFNQDKLRGLASQLKITNADLEKLLNTMGRTQAINQQVAALETLQREFGLTKQQALDYAKALNGTVSQAAKLKFMGLEIKPLNLGGIMTSGKLPTETITSEINRIGSSLTQLSSLMANTFGKDINAQKLITDMGNITSAIGQARGAAEALNKINSGTFINAANQTKYAEAWRQTAQVMGITEGAAKKLYEQLARNNAINQQVNLLHTLQNAYGMTKQQALQLAESFNILIDKTARLRFLGSDIDGKSLFSGFNFTNMISQAMAAMGVVGGIYGGVEFAKSIGKTALQLDNVSLAFTSIYDSASRAQGVLTGIRQLSDQLGLSFIDTAEAAKTVFASVENTDFGYMANDVFRAFSYAGTALKLTTEQMKGIYLAVGQIYAKGKVSAEELRLQLAERLPGAVSLFAKSIGVTTKELDDMLKKGEVGLDSMNKFVQMLIQKYQVAASNASTGLQSELNRISNTWFDFKKGFINSEETADLVRSLGKAFKSLADNASSIATVVKEFAKFALITGAIYGVISAIKGLISLVGTLTVAFKSLKAAGSLLTAFATWPLAMASALGGLIYLFTGFNNELSASDKELKKFSEQIFDLDQDIKDLTSGNNQYLQSSKEVIVKELENKRLEIEAQLANLFKVPEIQPVTDFLGDLGLDEDWVSSIGSILERKQPGSFFQNILDNFRREAQKVFQDDTIGKVFEEGALGLAKKFDDAFRSGAAYADLKKISLDLDMLFKNMFLDLENKAATDGLKSSAKSAIEALKPLENLVLNLIKNARAYSAELNVQNEKMSEFGQYASEATAAYDKIATITKGTATDKAAGLERNINTLGEEVIRLYSNATVAQAEIDNLGDAFDKTTDDGAKLQSVLDHYKDSLPRIAEYAIQNKITFTELETAIANMGEAAGWSIGELQGLLDALRNLSAAKIGDSIAKSIEQLGLKAQMAGATSTAQSVVSIITKDVADLGVVTKVQAAAIKGDWEGVAQAMQGTADVTKDQVLQIVEFNKQIEEGRKRASASSRGSRGAGSRSQSAMSLKKQLSDAYKEADNLNKKIADLQSTIQDDASIKFWVDVQSELIKIDDIIKKGTGTEQEKKKLQELAKEYENLARVRLEIMEQEERWQRAQDAASQIKNIGNYGALGDVQNLSGLSEAARGLAEGGLKAQYEEMENNFRKSVEKMGLDYSLFADDVANLQKELNIKLSAMNGDFSGQFTDMAMQEFDSLKNWKDQIVDMFGEGINTMSDAFAEFFITGIQNSENLGKAFSNLVKSMIADLAKLFMKMVVWGTISKVFGSFFNSGVPTSGYSGGTANFSDVGPVIPNGVYSAKGNVFSGGNISKYSNSVISSPIVFSGQHLAAYARGGGIAGEAGPEAILPLKRGIGGRLGVEANIGNNTPELNQNINVNVINKTDSQVTTSNSRDNYGNTSINIMIEKMVGDAMRRPGSAPFRALQDAYGASTVLANR